jgi:hypothetical protein
MSSQDPTLPERYLANQLTFEERVAFESALHEDPGLLADVEATARLKVGLARLREKGELEALLQDTPRGSLGKWLPLAAGLAALTIGVMVWQPAPRPAPTLLTRSAGHSLPVLASVAVFRKRSGGPDAVAALPGSAGALELRVLPTNPAASSRYGLQLAGIGSIDDLTPAADGFVTAYVDVSHLSPGQYRLTLSVTSSSGKSFPFETFDVELTRRDKNQ